MPGDLVWPRDNKNFPCLFLAQINLAEVNRFDLVGELPDDGILYFFHELHNWSAGCVLYTQEIDNLDAAPIPLELQKEYKSFWQKLFNLKGRKFLLHECSVELSTEYYLPDVESLYMELLLDGASYQEKVNVFQEEIYENEPLYEKGESEMTPNHHLLGHYRGIQHEYYQLEAIGSRIGIQNPSKEEIKRALEWKLLFQFDSDNNHGLPIGDWGRIYFFIHEDDLREHNFDRVKLVGECY